MSGFQTDLNSAFRRTVQRWDFKMEKTLTDLVNVLEQFKAPMKARIQEAKQQFTAIKITFIVTVE